MYICKLVVYIPLKAVEIDDLNIVPFVDILSTYLASRTPALSASTCGVDITCGLG